MVTLASFLAPRHAAGKSRRWLGLDLGSQSIKLAALEQTASGPRLVKMLIQDLPAASSASSATRAVDQAGWLQAALKEFDTRDVHVSMTRSDMILQRVHLPLMSTRELPEAIKWQIKDQLPFPLHDAVVDFQVLGEVWEKDIKKQDVLVAAVSRPVVQDLIATVERAGGRLASLTPTPMALWRSAAVLTPHTQQGSVAVVEVGASDTHVVLIKEGHVRLVRTLAVGGSNMTEALMGVVASEHGEITIDVPKAEALKRRYGVMTQDAEGTTDEGIPLFHLSSLMRPVLESLLIELSRLLAFYKMQVDEAGVSRLLLCGGGANLKSLQPFLAEGLGVTVECFNPLIRMPERLCALEPEQVADGGPRLAVAIGLALDHGQSLNLLPADLKRHKALALSRRVWLSAAHALAVMALLFSLGLHVVSGSLRRQLRQHQQQWEQMEPAYRQSMTLLSTRKTLEGTLDQTQQFLDQQPVWEGLLKEVGQLIPPALELDEVTVSSETDAQGRPGRVHLKGRVLSDGTGQDGGVAQFIAALERSVFFKDVELVSSEMRIGTAGATRFELEGSLE